MHSLAVLKLRVNPNGLYVLIHVAHRCCVQTPPSWWPPPPAQLESLCLPYFGSPLVSDVHSTAMSSTIYGETPRNLGRSWEGNQVLGCAIGPRDCGLNDIHLTPLNAVLPRSGGRTPPKSFGSLSLVEDISRTSPLGGGQPAYVPDRECEHFTVIHFPFLEF